MECFLEVGNARDFRMGRWGSLFAFKGRRRALDRIQVFLTATDSFTHLVKSISKQLLVLVDPKPLSVVKHYGEPIRPRLICGECCEGDVGSGRETDWTHRAA